jgi:ornithine carbamoyltransferase
MRHLRRLEDLSVDDVHAILDLAHDLKAATKRGEREPRLAGRVLSQVFEKPSLRTRASFEAAMGQLGGSAIFYLGKDAGLGGRESLADVARVLSGYSDAVVLRTFSQRLIDDFAEHANCPVVNGLSDDRHPCQALTDVLTLQEVFGRDLAGRTLVFVGDGNNVAASLAILTAMLGMRFVLCGPASHHLPAAFVADVTQQHANADISQTDDVDAAVASADAVYTDVWASMGQEAEHAARERAFAPYQVNAGLLAKAPPGCRFLHDLPARRGLEVTDAVMDGPQSIVFEQAENRMHLAKGLLVWLIERCGG